MGIGSQAGSAPLRAPKGWSMEKWLCWGSLGVAGVLLVLFVLDLFMQIPFGRISVTVDVLGALAALLVAYLAWDAYSDLR